VEQIMRRFCCQSRTGDLDVQPYKKNQSRKI